jgi:nucleoside-diphosphate-sugar epimerase
MVQLSGRRIVLVGGGGFIGHNLALELKRRGAEVSIIDGLNINNFLSFRAAKNKDYKFYLKILHQRMDMLEEAGIPLYIQDARDYFSLTNLIVKLMPQTLVQLAAVAHANISNKDPYSTFDHSFRTLENALDVARDNIEHFVYFSSSMVYGNFVDGSVTERTHCEPLGIYGALKLGGEKLVIAYNQAFDLPYTIVRPSALYGERCVSRRVVQVFIENAARGSDISVTGDGSDRLDFTYIDDLVSGLICVVENEASRNQIFNLTYGESRSIGELASIVAKHFPGIKLNYVPKDKLTPDRGTLSVEKARTMIGYRPQFPLEKGVDRYVEWYKELFAEKGRGY